MIRSVGHAHANTGIELPIGTEVEVERWHDLLLLVVDRIKTGNRAEGAVVFQTELRPLGDLIGSLEIGRKDESLAYAGPMESAVHGGVERQIPLADLLVDDRADLHAPGVL